MLQPAPVLLGSEDSDEEVGRGASSDDEQGISKFLFEVLVISECE